VEALITGLLKKRCNGNLPLDPPRDPKNRRKHCRCSKTEVRLIASFSISGTSFDTLLPPFSLNYSIKAISESQEGTGKQNHLNTHNKTTFWFGKGPTNNRLSRHEHLRKTTHMEELKTLSIKWFRGGWTRLDTRNDWRIFFWNHSSDPVSKYVGWYIRVRVDNKRMYRPIPLPMSGGVGDDTQHGAFDYLIVHLSTITP